MRNAPLMIASAALLLAQAAPVAAHPKLLAARPAANAISASPPKRIELRFSEGLISRFAGADLFIKDSGPKARAPIKLASTTTVAADGHTLIVTPAAQLRPGVYNLAWRVVSVDTHRVTGNHPFTIR